jgi:hypothetical protein
MRQLLKPAFTGSPALAVLVAHRIEAAEGRRRDHGERPEAQKPRETGPKAMGDTGLENLPGASLR